MSGRATERPRDTAPLPLLGAHLSTAGGVASAIERARALRCTALQIFTHNRAQWRVTDPPAGEVERFRDLVGRHGPFALAAHASYLVNPASPDRALRDRSRRVLVAEVRHCALLGIPALVLHPGAHTGSGERAGLQRIVSTLNRVHAETGDLPVLTLLETTAGQGSGLGHRFEQLAEIFGRLARPERAAVCFDTAHALAAGYDFRTPELYARTWEAFDRSIGLERLALFHCNDSRTPPGSRVDRHTHIGRGTIGRAPFGWILADRRFRSIPKVIETPKEGDMDRRNLALLRRLARATPPHAGLPIAASRPAPRSAPHPARGDLAALIARLRKALRGPLPGARAQARMAPRPRPGWDPSRGAPAGRAAAVLALLYPGTGGEIGAGGRPGTPTLLLTERTGFVERHKRQVSFPGGVIEAGESAERAALREAFEETGVPLDQPRVLGPLTPLWVPASGFTIQPVVAWSPARPPLAPHAAEVDRILEVSLEYLLDPRSLARRAMAGGGRWVDVPFFDLDGTMLWGASAMITAELLALLGWTGPSSAD